jgi:hypothetical protein
MLNCHLAVDHFHANLTILYKEKILTVLTIELKHMLITLIKLLLHFKVQMKIK